MPKFLQNIPFGEFQWVEIIYAVVGSFVGIFIPLFIEKSNARRQEKDGRNKLLSSLNRELDSIVQLIEDYRKPEHQYEIFSFSTFVWQSIIAAGMLPDMLSDKRIQGNLLIEIYSDLNLLQELHDEFCQCTQKEDLRMIYDSIVQKRDEVYEKITHYRSVGNTR
ncbi:MAG: hypothetical protein E7453_01170 [Ruminococcaceae bacterium]|nr:hypothetical protein [Oscillospiraceae bacterium]